MPPKRSTPASRPHKGIDPLDRQRSAAKSKTHEEREGGDAALAPAPFRVPRVYELDAAYKFVFVILMGVAHYSLHGQRLSEYAWDVFLFQLLNLLELGSVWSLWTLASTTSRPSSSRAWVITVASVAFLVLLSIRISIRYSPIIIALPLMCEPMWVGVWGFTVGGFRSSTLTLSKLLPFQLLSFIVCRGLAAGLTTVILPAYAIRDEYALIDWPFVCVLFTVSVSLSSAVEIVHTVISLQTAVNVTHGHEEGEPNPSPALVSAAAVVCAAGFWEPVEDSHKEQTSVPKDASKESAGPPPKWSKSGVYSHGDTVSVPREAASGFPEKESGKKDVLLFAAVGSCGSSTHPLSLYSRFMQVLVRDPQRLIMASVFAQVVFICLVVECGFLLRRWELYLGLAIGQFIALAATFTLGYLPLLNITGGEYAQEGKGEQPAQRQ